MKNKKLLYILIPAVFIVWGLVFYRIWNGLQTEQTSDLVASGGSEIESKFKIDTFSLHLGERDPFRMGRHSSPVIPHSNGNNLSKPPKADNSTSNAWPAISYNGKIKNQKSRKELAMVQVNGQSNLMKAGEKWGEIELLKVYRDSILVRYGQEKKYVRK